MASEQELMQQYENELALAQQGQSMGGYSPSMYGNQQKQNLVEWELDFKSELEDIERLLRCDVLIRDKEGNEYWTRNPHPERIFLNDLGVNDTLRKIRILVNKNKVLSNYKIEEIQARVSMIAHEIRVLIYNNYEMYGIDNEYKMNNYSMTVISIMSLIEDAYRRALGGEAHRGLSEQRLVTQNESFNPMGMQGYPMMMNGGNQGTKQKKWYNPFGWFK